MDETSTTEMPSGGLHLALWAVQALLAFAFLMAGGFKLAMPLDELVANGVAVAGRAPRAVILAIGLAEVLGAVGLILPSALRIRPSLTVAAAGGLVLTMVVATIEHLANGETEAIGATITLGLLAAFVAWGRLSAAPIPAK